MKYAKDGFIDSDHKTQFALSVALSGGFQKPPLGS
jgi:hypothetical protein